MAPWPSEAICAVRRSVADPRGKWQRVEALPCLLTVEIPVPTSPSAISFSWNTGRIVATPGPWGKTFPAWSTTN